MSLERSMFYESKAFVLNTIYISAWFMLSILSMWWDDSRKEKQQSQNKLINWIAITNTLFILMLKCIHKTHLYFTYRPVDWILTTGTFMYINPHTHTYIHTHIIKYIHTNAHVNRHIIHLCLVMRANIGAYPFLAAKRRKRSHLSQYLIC